MSHILFLYTNTDYTKMKKVILFIVFSFFTIHLQADDLKLVFSKANKAFQAGNYSEAIDLYEQVGQQKHSAYFYFNLGNAYYKNGELGKAMLNYERAKLLQPSFPDLNYNIDLTKNRLKDNISPVRPFFLAVWWSSIYNVLSPTSWAILGIIWLLAAVGCIGFWLLGNTRQKKQLGFFGGIGLSILGFVFLLAGLSRHQVMTNSNEAIVIVKKTDLKDGADTDSNTILYLHEGAKVFLIEKIGDWQKVTLEDGELGWLKDDVFEKITR